MELDWNGGIAIDTHDICVIVWTPEESHLKQTGNLEEKDEFLEPTFSVMKLE